METVSSDVEDHLETAIIELCHKALDDAKLLCWAFALPEQIKADRWLPTDICNIISKHLDQAITRNALKNKGRFGEKYVITPDIDICKLEDDYKYPEYSAILSYSDYIHVMFSLIDGELRPMAYSKNVITIDFSDFSSGYSKSLDGPFEHWMCVDGYFIKFIEGDETAQPTAVNIQILNLNYEFPGIWFDEPLNDTLSDRVYNACMALGSASGFKVTRYRDHSMEISESYNRRANIRKLPNGEFEIKCTIEYDRAHEIDREELQAALIALLGPYL